MEQINMHQNQAIGASNTVQAITDGLGPFEKLSNTESKRIVIKAIMAGFKVRRSALEGSVSEFEEGLRAGCGKTWSGADAQEIDSEREAIKTIDTHTAQFEGLLKTLQ
jgi:hypothetical protein